MKRYGMAVIGLGVVGRRMLEQAAVSRGIQIVSAWDLSASARATAATAFPGLPLSQGVTAAIERLDVDVVYVAVPPLAHAQTVRTALAAGKAVFCEKPLAVDIREGTELVDAVRRAGVREAVNFVFASSAAVDSIARTVRNPAFGLRAIEVRTRFHEWPRAWQADATWLQQAEQGGFTREVLSHFVYLLHRIFGQPDLLGAAVFGPSAHQVQLSETSLSATLSCAGVPVSLTGSVGGQPPDLVEARFIGSSSELRLSDWYRLDCLDASAPNGKPVVGLPDDPRLATYQRQLDQLHAMLSGEAHSLPSFADALIVQTLIENMLSTRTSR